VTTELDGLAAEGCVERHEGSWLLRGGPPSDYAELP
jgi:hypothetical protein